MSESQPFPADSAAARRVLRNTAWMAANSGLTICLGVLTVVFLARGLGPRLMGIYATLTAAIGVLAIAVDFGTDMLVTREVARDRRRGRHVVAVAGLFKLVFSFWPSALLLLLLPVLYGYREGQVRLAFLLGAAVLALEGVWSLFSSALKGLERMSRVAGVNVAGATLQALAVLTVFVTEVPLAAAAAALIASGALRAYAGWLCWRKAAQDADAGPGERPAGLGMAGGTGEGLSPLAPGDGWMPLFSEARRLAPAAGVFFLTAVVFALHDRLDIFLVSYLRGAEEAGQYGVAARFSAALSVLPGAMVAALYPYLSRRPRGEQATFRRLRLAATAYGVAAAAAAFAGGRPLIAILLGEAFLPAWLPLAVRVWVLPFQVAATFLAIRHYSHGRERPVALCTAAGLGLNLILNLLFIPPWGGTGAAAATVASELAVFVLLLRLGRGARQAGIYRGPG